MTDLAMIDTLALAALGHAEDPGARVDTLALAAMVPAQQPGAAISTASMTVLGVADRPGGAMANLALAALVSGETAVAYVEGLALSVAGPPERPASQIQSLVAAVVGPPSAPSAYLGAMALCVLCHPPAPTPVVGRRVPVRLYVESIYATPPAGAASLRAYFASWSVAPAAALRTIDILSAARRPLIARSAPVLSGSVETTVAPETIGWWLYHLLGRVTTTGAGPYTHTVSVSALPIGFTAEKEVAPYGVERQSGLGIQAASLDLSPGTAARLSMTLTGARQTVAEAPLDPSPRDDGHCEWIGRDITLTQDGLSLGTVTALTLAIDNRRGASPLALLGRPCGLPAGRCAITLRLQAILTDLAWTAQALAGTPSDFAIRIARGTGDGTAGHEVLTLTLTACVINPNAPTIDTEYGLIADLSILVGDLTAVLHTPLPSVLP